MRLFDVVERVMGRPTGLYVRGRFPSKRFPLFPQCHSCFCPMPLRPPNVACRLSTETDADQYVCFCVLLSSRACRNSKMNGSAMSLFLWRPARLRHLLSLHVRANRAGLLFSAVRPGTVARAQSASARCCSTSFRERSWVSMLLEDFGGKTARALA
jgi:hypothetical protein